MMGAIFFTPAACKKVGARSVKFTKSVTVRLRPWMPLGQRMASGT